MRKKLYICNIVEEGNCEEEHDCIHSVPHKWHEGQCDQCGTTGGYCADKPCQPYKKPNGWDK